MFTVGGRRTRVSVVALLVIVTGATALQIVNTLGVRAELLRRCAQILGEDRCEVGTGLASVELSMDASAIGRELRVGRPRFRANTSLVRTSCQGSWVAGLGGRGEVQALDISAGALELDAGRGCIDMSRAGATGRLVDAQLRTQGCVIHLAPLEFGAERAVALRVGAAFDRATVDACRRLMPPAAAGSTAISLADARIDLETSYAFETIAGEAQGEAAWGGTDAGAEGLVRRILASAPTSHRFTATLDGSSITVRVDTEPAGDSARISLSAHAEGDLASRVFPDAPADPIDPQTLALEWILDHGSGTVRVNGTEVRRFPSVATRPAGRVVLSASECGSTRTRRALYFVEAGDEGQALDPSQIDGVFTALDTAVSRSGALVAVFVHGWHHSAAPGDSYVCRYSDVLASVEEMEVRASALSGRAPREVLGVYVGWPGALYPDELANSATTFWNRLDAADRLGSPDALLTQLLGGLSQRLAGRTTGAAADRRSSLLVVGHSMGARAVFAALGGETFGTSKADGSPAPDLVLLVNPAFSASLYRSISERTRECRRGIAPLLLFSSEADAVTRQLYPAGQTVTYPYGSAQPAPFLEHVYTAANFAAFVTHRLSLDLVSGEPPAPEGPQTILGGFERVPSGSRELYDDNPVVVYRQPSTGRPRAGDVWYRMRLADVSPAPQTPCDVADGGASVIAVDRGILPDHGRIFTPPFVEYVVRVLNRRAAASLAGR